MKKLFIFLVISALAMHVQAQTHSTQTHTTHSTKKTSALYFGIGLYAGIPSGEFADYNDHLPFGGDLNLFFQPSKNIPVLIGCDLAFMGDGSKTETQTLEADVTVGSTVIDRLYFPLRFEISNLIFQGNIDLRVMAPTRYFKPYVDGIVGVSNFSTSTSIYDESEENYFTDNENNLITSQTQSSDWALNYGAAGGLMVELGKSVLLNLRCAYIRGTTASYYVKDDIENWDITISSASLANPDDVSSDDIDISAIPETSETDMILPSVGITFTF